ncbi:MAG: hypothetical protein ABJ205_05745 [Erythrobacter sp.]|uniref:hypothetical protein n=1 Tax=Erythrobacter sp. TaxID=1042 RepID=UPI00326490FF
MTKNNHPFLLTVMLLAFAVRVAFGAPCCLPPLNTEPVQASAIEHEVYAHDGAHQSHDETSHEGHADGPNAQPCCSACGSSLPAESVVVDVPQTQRSLPEPEPVRALKTRPPFPAYDARGPPLLI